MSNVVTMHTTHLVQVVRSMRQQDCFEIGEIWREPDFVDWAKRHAERPGVHFSLISNYSPVACGGVLDAMPGVGTGWLVATEEWRKHLRTFLGAFRVLIADGYYRRLQAFINPKNEPAINFVSWLGFEYEGECKRLAPNGDSLLMFAHTRR